MTTLKERLEEVMQEHGLKTQQQLAEFAGVSKGLVGQWFKGDTGLGAKPLLAFETKTNFSTRWLVEGKGDKYRNVGKQGEGEMSAAPSNHAREPNNVYPTAHRLRQVPLISWVQAGKAHDAQWYDQQEMVSIISHVGQHAYALRVDGDSMEPEFTAGDIIIIDPDAEARAGSFVVAWHDDGTTLKQLIFDGSKPLLKPLNKIYLIKPLLMDEGERILGVVVEKLKQYR